MILSNNPKTYILIGIHHSEAITNIYKKYIYRWVGPSSAHTFKLRLNLWKNSNIKLRRIYDLKQ